MKKLSVNWKNNFSQLGNFFNSTKLIVFLNMAHPIYLGEKTF